MKSLILVLSFYYLLGIHTPLPKNQDDYNIVGKVVNTKTGEGVLFVGIKFFVNDSLTKIGLTDLDGFYHLNNIPIKNNVDQLKIQYLFLDSVYEERIIVNPLKDTTLFLNIEFNIDTLIPREVMSWKTQFFKSVPRKLVICCDGD